MATKRTSTRKDFTQVALSVAQRAAGEVTAPAPSKKPENGRTAAGTAAPASVKKRVAKKP